MILTKLKVYELAKELSVDSQQLVDIVQRLGIHQVKNAMGVLGSEEVRVVREYVKKHRPMVKSSVPVPPKAGVSEKRVGATVIRRRAVDKKDAAPAPEVEEVIALASTVQVEIDTQESSEAPEDVPPVEPEEAQTEEDAGEEVVPVMDAAPSVETQITEEVSAGPQASVAKPAEPAPSRRAYPSIIKRVTTEQHLGEVVGPKVERPIKPKVPVGPAAGAAARGKVGVVAPVGTVGPRRVKEVELAGVITDPAKDAGRRRVAQRQATVFRSTDYLKRELVHATRKRKGVASRAALKTQITVAAQHKRVVEMKESISVAELAKEMGIKAIALVKKLMSLGVTATMNQSIDFDTATLVAQELGYEVKQKVFRMEDHVPTPEGAAAEMSPRGPVVTIMGHVDHGKTSLLDAIRKTKVAAGEAGGITQHVGAYRVNVPNGKITFIDTPGHEAFTAMRARGAKVTDIVIVVVSAVDGVMPQTLESVSHAQAANVPIIVAVNKIDLPDANPDRVKQTLAGHGLNPEEWGGDTIYVSVSAKTGHGLDQLLENILLQAELLELKAVAKGPARGRIIESRLDKARGPMASALVLHGKLEIGQVVACGAAYGKVRAMVDSQGGRLTEALPGEPVEILGLCETPNVGDEFYIVEDEKKAREISEGVKLAAVSKTAERPKMTLEELMAGMTGEKELKLILKVDVQGSEEALREALTKLPADKVKVRVLHRATGGITESDVMLAAASRAAILGFNVRPDIKAAKLGESEGVQLRTYTIIYDLLEDVRKMMEGLLDTTTREKVIGRAEVREVFSVPKVGTIAGSAVIDGKVQRGCYLRLLRESRVIYEGKLSSLRRFKDDVKEVASGFECGIGLENFNDVKRGDQFEAFLKEEVKEHL